MGAENGHYSVDVVGGARGGEQRRHETVMQWVQRLESSGLQMDEMRRSPTGASRD